MPRPGPRKPNVGVRLDADTLRLVDLRAEQAGVSRSETLRRLISEGLRAKS